MYIYIYGIHVGIPMPAPWLRIWDWLRLRLLLCVLHLSAGLIQLLSTLLDGQRDVILNLSCPSQRSSVQHKGLEKGGCQGITLEFWHVCHIFIHHYDTIYNCHFVCVVCVCVLNNSCHFDRDEPCIVTIVDD